MTSPQLATHGLLHARVEGSQRTHHFKTGLTVVTRQLVINGKTTGDMRVFKVMDVAVLSPRLKDYRRPRCS